VAPDHHRDRTSHGAPLEAHLDGREVVGIEDELHTPTDERRVDLERVRMKTDS
jgi:hypothetical protein